MIIKSMHLKHYRCFDDFDITFDDQLTVLVGVNGAGKTATLDALSSFLEMVCDPINLLKNNVTMSANDVAAGYQPEDIVYKIEIVLSHNEQSSLFVLFDEIHKMNNNILLLVRDIPTITEIIDAEQVLCVGYMAGRYISDSDTTLKQNVSIPSTTAAFKNNFNRTIDYASTIEWFNNIDADEARLMRDTGQKDELPELAAVRESLSKALLGKYKNPRMKGSPPELIVYEKGSSQEFKVSQLSDGYRAMLALVMDLSRRMYESNKYYSNENKSLLNTPAIVLIDEVELHLHPSWQQTVLTTLMEIFPSTQFIVTTHSPQVIASIPSKHIRILEGGKVHTLDEQVQGAESSRLLNRVFGVDSRPGNLEIVRNLNEYSKLVYNEEFDTTRARELRKILDEHFGKDEPKLLELDLHIENKIWERSL